MTQQVINIGNTANDGTGSPLRSAFEICNENFTELYNIGGATQKIVLEALQNKEFVKKSVELIKIEKENLILKLASQKDVIQIFPSEANFVLIKFNQAQELFDYLISQKVITRNRTNVSLCEGSIRITIGLPDENAYLLKKISDFYA